MSTKLLSVVEWVRPYVSNLFMLNDATLEPAMTNANILLGTILGPPFVWEWNRNATTFTCTAGTTDYTGSVGDFGYLEEASLQVPTTAPNDAGTIYQLSNSRTLSPSSQPGRPAFISINNDDLNGNITFRLGSSNPDQAYILEVTYQQALVPITSVSALIPMPDKLVHIFKYGFLAMSFLYAQDSRFNEMNQKFIATLLGSQSGLDNLQKNIFLGQWLSALGEEGAVALSNQQGYQARGAS